MADAVMIYERVCTGVTLTLTHDEARALRSLLGSIAGDPKVTVRKHLDPIYEALDNAGVASPSCAIKFQYSGFKHDGKSGEYCHSIHIVA